MLLIMGWDEERNGVCYLQTDMPELWLWSHYFSGPAMLAKSHSRLEPSCSHLSPCTLPANWLNKVKLGLLKLQEERLHSWNFLNLTVWEALAGRAYSGMNVSCVKTPVSDLPLPKPSLSYSEHGPQRNGAENKQSWSGLASF